MKDFLIQCLKDLEPLTGIRQLYFLEQDEDGQRKIDVTIEGMLIVSKQFEYIPVDAQRKIIRESMIKDQDYKQLDSRTLYKWLNGNASSYWAKSNEIEHFEDRPAEPLSEATQKMVTDFLSSLAQSMEADKRNRMLSGKRLKEEMDKIVTEDEIRAQGLNHPIVTDTISQRKMIAAKARGLDKLRDGELIKFVVDGEVIFARTLEEAQEIYLEVI